MPGLDCAATAVARVFELAKFLPVFHELAIVVSYEIITQT